MMGLSLGMWRLRKKAGAAAYSGAGDIVSGATAWWGLRAYTAASIGGNVVKIRRSSDSTTKVFVSIAGGGINTSDAFFDGSNYFVDTLYDQTGGGHDLTQATTASQAPFKLNALGTLPAINRLSGSPNNAAFAGAFTQAQPFVLSCVGEAIANHTSFCNFFSSDTSTIQIGPASSAGNWFIYAGSSILSASASGGSPHALQGTWNNASSELYIDGSATSGSLGAATGITTTPKIPGDANLSADIYVFEVGIWSGTWTGTQKANMNSNQHNYYIF